MSNSVESIAKNKRIKLRNNIERIDNTMTKLSKETIENFFKAYSEMAMPTPAMEVGVFHNNIYPPYLYLD
jgi:hypothetical protein